MFVILMVAVLMLSGCASKQPLGPEAARALIEESAESLGGWAAMDAIKAQEIVTAGGDWEPLQAVDPKADAPQVNSFGQTVFVDFANKKMRLTFDAQRTYPAPAPVKFAEIIDGDAGMLSTIDAEGKVVNDRLHPSRYATRLRDLNRLPLRVLYTAKNAPELTREKDQIQGRSVIHVLKYKDANLPVELHIDSFNKLPVRVIYTEDDPVYGDTLNELAYSDWKEVSGGVRLPQTMTLFLNGKKIREEQVRTLINNPKPEAFAFSVPDEIRALPENGERVISQWTLRRAIMGVGFNDFARPQTVQFVDVAPGVFHITGSSHHSMVIEMADHLIVVELPLYEERSAAVIKALEEKFPGKPIKYGIVTHFHIDHSGGLRAYAAKGATILADESIVTFIKGAIDRPKTIRPDALAKAGSANAAVEGVTGTKELTDGSRTVELRPIANSHASGMLAVYLPKEKVVFVSDLYSPGTPVQPGNPNAHAFYTALKDANLAVDRIVGGHGGIGPFSDLAKVD